MAGAARNRGRLPRQVSHQRRISATEPNAATESAQITTSQPSRTASGRGSLGRVEARLDQ